MATTAISFAEVVQNSDIPPGVVNILTGFMDELLPHMASHMDVNALVMAREGIESSTLQAVTENVKRYIDRVHSFDELSPYQILDLQELKTTWHPVQVGAGASGGY